MSTVQDQGYRHILKYTGIFGGVQGFQLVLGLLRTKLMAILLAPSGMGLASLFQSTSQFLSQATNLGVSMSAVRQLSEDYETADKALLERSIQTVRGWSLLTALLGLLVALVLGPVLSQTTFDWGNHSLHFVLLGPAVAMIAPPDSWAVWRLSNSSMQCWHCSSLYLFIIYTVKLESCPSSI